MTGRRKSGDPDYSIMRHRCRDGAVRAILVERRNLASPKPTLEESFKITPRAPCARTTRDVGDIFRDAQRGFEKLRGEDA